MDKDFIDLLLELCDTAIKTHNGQANVSNEGEDLFREAKEIKLVFEGTDKLIEDAKKLIEKEGHQFNIERIDINNFYEIRLKHNKFYQKIKSAYDKKKVQAEELISSILFETWNQNIGAQEGIEKYFNTPDELFNSNAFYWRFEITTKKLFDDLEVPYQIMMKYFDFLKMRDKPISCADLLFEEFDKHELNKEQRVFILNKFTGIFYHSGDASLSNIFIELTDRRHQLAPYDEDPDFYDHAWDIDVIREELKEIQTIFEKIRYLKHKKLEYEWQSKEIKYDIGFSEKLDIEIKHFEDVLEKISEYELDKVISREIFTLISKNGFNQILDFILLLGKNLEKYSDLTSKLDEEKIRDYFLPALNSVTKKHFAGGEIFNKKGKTDILLQDSNGNNVFIAECKIWNGEQYLDEAINQLFERYVNWRDERVSIMIFNKHNSGFTSIINKAIKTLKSNKLYLNYVGQRKETSYSFEYKHPLDDMKKISLELLLFNFYN